MTVGCGCEVIAMHPLVSGAHLTNNVRRRLHIADRRLLKKSGVGRKSCQRIVSRLAIGSLRLAHADTIGANLIQDELSAAINASPEFGCVAPTRS